MKLNKPSYGVFMVDIFASSVGIFILVSLLYIIGSAQVTSDQAMVERFKTLIKRDLVPVDRYSMPVNNDPLHDWGVRARHAREQREALVLLLRDKVLLYHDNQLLDLQQIIDTDILLNYYHKYNKNNRLFLEIHYHDAYHGLKAKIAEALPENVHQWIHWAYNAGNISHPNPVAANAPRPNLNLQPGTAGPSLADPNQAGLSSSLASSAQGRSGGTGQAQNDQVDGQPDGQAGGQPDGQAGGQPDGQVGGQPDGQVGGQPDGQAGGQSTQEQPLDPVTAQVSKQLNRITDSKSFVEQFMAQRPEQTPSEQAKGNPQPGQNPTDKTSAADGEDGEGGEDGEDGEDGESPNKTAAEHIRNHVFLQLPWHSPIGRFELDIRIPGFKQQQFSLTAVSVTLHQQPDAHSPSQRIALSHGDAIVPLEALPQSQPDDQAVKRRWLKIMVIKVSGQTSVPEGWLYGFADPHQLLLPLLPNDIRAITRDDYWFEQQADPLQSFSLKEQP